MKLVKGLVLGLGLVVSAGATAGNEGKFCSNIGLAAEIAHIYQSLGEPKRAVFSQLRSADMDISVQVKDMVEAIYNVGDRAGRQTVVSVFTETCIEERWYSKH